VGQIEHKTAVFSPNASDINCKTNTTVDDVRLSIDFISINVDLPPEMVALIEKFISDIAKNTSAGETKHTSPFHRYYDRYYRSNCKAYLNNILAWEPTGASAFICQTGSKRPDAKNTRFAWNPSKCDSVTVAGIIFDGYLNIPPSCLLDATVSCIHVAADVPKVRVDDQAISYPKMRRVENRFSGGRTMYLGVQSGHTRIVAYDKRNEIKSANAKLGNFLSEIKEPVPAHELLRLEVQVKPHSLVDFALPMTVSELGDLPNVFAKLKVHSVPANLERAERLAVMLARHEGLRRAVEVAEFSSAEEKAFFRKLAKAGPPSWWKPETIWTAQFPSLAQKFIAPFMTPLPGAIQITNLVVLPKAQQLAESMTIE
jgi:hypothetical protein